MKGAHKQRERWKSDGKGLAGNVSVFVETSRGRVFHITLAAWLLFSAFQIICISHVLNVFESIAQVDTCPTVFG